jgi:hypothetical protein
MTINTAHPVLRGRRWGQEGKTEMREEEDREGRWKEGAGKEPGDKKMKRVETRRKQRNKGRRGEDKNGKMMGHPIPLLPWLVTRYSILSSYYSILTSNDKGPGGRLMRERERADPGLRMDVITVLAGCMYTHTHTTLSIP